MINFYDHHFSENKFSRNEKFEAGFELIATYEAQLAQELLGYLKSVEEIRIIGTSKADSSVRVPTISFIHSKLKSSEIVELVDKNKLGYDLGIFMPNSLLKT